MKLSTLPFLALITVAGCSAGEGNTSAQPNADARLTPQQNLQKIEGDSKMPDGLKRIQTETLQRQAGIKP